MHKLLFCAVLVSALLFVSSAAFTAMEMDHSTNTIRPHDGFMTIDGILTAGSIRANTVPFSFAIGTTDASVGTTEADMPEMSISVISDGSPISIRVWIGYEAGGSVHNTTFRLFRDAVEIRKWRHQVDAVGQSETTEVHWIDQPSAATYTYKVTWQAGSHTSIRNASSDGFEGSIISAMVINR